MNSILSALLLFFAFEASAKIEALFHPKDPTLERIGQWIRDSEQSIDIAMYNMETSSISPVIQALKSEEVQKKIKNGTLTVRVIFEGSDSFKSKRKMEDLEKLGLDARFLGRSLKMHHKFAVIDSELAKDRVITGSANWSMASYSKYNENILFFENENEATVQFQSEFNKLWNLSREYGISKSYYRSTDSTFADQPGYEVYYNSHRLLKNTDLSQQQEIWLTDKVVDQIEGAQNEILVASTRIRLQPILQALQRAANRGVQIRIILSQDDYRDLWKRSNYLLKNPNIRLRVKFYSLKVSDYLEHQMHHKFMIVDGHTVLSGSFNWSKSSEENHIENLISYRKEFYPDLIREFISEFFQIWKLGRDHYEKTLLFFRENEQYPCAFTPMVLSVPEIKKILSYRQRCLQAHQ